ncbi:hypothetical protein [Amycolatopsis sp. cmx-11-51]|uniref:hypothetical protein n=1 Tax=unclassified Amycolatopsis TaxID=2618356 RepID=UPI0039E5A8DB
MNPDRVTCNVSASLETAADTSKTGAAARDNTDLLMRRAQGFSHESAQGEYGQAVLAKNLQHQRLANEQWDGHDNLSGSVTNGVHGLVNAKMSSINRLG